VILDLSVSQFPQLLGQDVVLPDGVDLDALLVVLLEDPSLLHVPQHHIHGEPVTPALVAAEAVPIPPLLDGLGQVLLLGNLVLLLQRIVISAPSVERSSRLSSEEIAEQIY